MPDKLSINSRMTCSLISPCLPRVNAFSASYGRSYPSLRKMVCTPYATTAQFLFRSSRMTSLLTCNLFNPRVKEARATSAWPIGTPKFRSTVLSVKSRCNREIGSLLEKKCNVALLSPKLPYAFSKSIGFTLCGIALLPTSPTLMICVK